MKLTSAFGVRSLSAGRYTAETDENTPRTMIPISVVSSKTVHSLWAGILVFLIGGCASPDSAEPDTNQAAQEGYATMDDGVRLYYKMVGDGQQVVVVPAALYLSEALMPLADKKRIVFYDPRNRGQSDAADTSTVSLDRQVQDLEQLRLALGIDQMALIGWSGLGMEMAVYTLHHPERVTRLVQVSAVPPSASIMAATGDQRASRVDQNAIEEVNRQAEAGEIEPEEHCRSYNALTLSSNFVDTALVAQIPDVCQHENEWPINLWPYFGALLGSFGDYDWLPALSELTVPRLVIHGQEDGIPVEGAYAWASGFSTARLIVLSPAGHFPFLEQPTAFFSAVDQFLGGAWPEGAVLVEQ